LEASPDPSTPEVRLGRVHGTMNTVSLGGLVATFSIFTHDGWGQVHVGDYPSLDEARAVFAALRDDPWYRADGTVKGLELARTQPGGSQERLEWFAFQP
jgi:hypothetical protein